MSGRVDSALSMPSAAVGSVFDLEVFLQVELPRERFAQVGIVLQ